jgi:RNA recognition motif-containing protein
MSNTHTNTHTNTNTYTRETNSDNRVFIGNLSWDATSTGLMQYLFPHATRAYIVLDKQSRLSLGYAFVDVRADDPGSLDAVLAFDGQAFQGRIINVELARPSRGTR